MGYSLDQKAQQTDQTSVGGTLSGQAQASGYHNTVINYQSGGDLSASTSAEASQSGSLPVWAWIAIGVAVVLGIYFWRRKT